MTAIKGTEQVDFHEAYVPDSGRRYLIITMGIIAVTYFISMFTDCLGVVLELNGILAAVPLAYILPALCYLKLEKGSIFSLDKLPALGLLIAGILAAISGLLLVIFSNQSTESCVHGKIMPYCLSSASIVDNATSISSVVTTTEAVTTTLSNIVSGVKGLSSKSV